MLLWRPLSIAVSRRCCQSVCWFRNLGLRGEPGQAQSNRGVYSSVYSCRPIRKLSPGHRVLHAIGFRQYVPDGAFGWIRHEILAGVARAPVEQGFAAPIVVGGEEYCFLIADQLACAGCTADAIIGVGARKDITATASRRLVQSIGEQARYTDMDCRDRSVLAAIEHPGQRIAKIPSRHVARQCVELRRRSGKGLDLVGTHEGRVFGYPDRMTGDRRTAIEDPL